MKRTHFNLVLIATVLSVIVLSSAWEFLFEDLADKAIDVEHEPESLSHRLEFVISATVFVMISLIFPAMVGYKLIDNEEKLTETIKRLSEED